jgi:hypothetical protein
MSGISVHPNAHYSSAANVSEKANSQYHSNIQRLTHKKNVEGFTTGNDVKKNVFEKVLRMPKSSITESTSVPGKNSGKTNTNSGKCPPTNSSITATAKSALVLSEPNAYTPPAFLSKIIKDEKDTVQSLLRTAAKIGPMANTIVESESASDAAFISKAPSPIPTYGSTLQGFTFILFFWSFLSFAIVIAIYINQTTGNTANAVGTFVACISIMLIIFTLMKRYA